MGTLGEGHSYTSYPKTLMRQLVYVVTFTSTVMLGVAFFLNLQIPPKYIGNVIVTGVGILTIIALKRGDPLNLGVVPLILTIFASASFKVYISGEMQPFDYSGYTIMIFISAFVLSRVYYWLLTATAICTLATIYVSQLFSDNQQIAIGATHTGRNQ